MSFEEIKNKSLELLAKQPFSKVIECLKFLLNYIEDLKAEIKKKTTENQELKDENKELKNKVESLSRDSTNSNKPPSSDGLKKNRQIKNAAHPVANRVVKRGIREKPDELLRRKKLLKLWNINQKNVKNV